jgi:hypothetical protein
MNSPMRNLLDLIRWVLLGLVRSRTSLEAKIVTLRHQLKRAAPKVAEAARSLAIFAYLPSRVTPSVKVLGEMDDRGLRILHRFGGSPYMPSKMTALGV